MSVKILSPDGGVGRVPGALAPSPAVLAGLRIAVLDNGKPGAELLMDAVAQQIAQRTGGQMVGTFRKGSAATPCEDALLDELGNCADLVVTGTAD